MKEIITLALLLVIAVIAAVIFAMAYIGKRGLANYYEQENKKYRTRNKVLEEQLKERGVE